MFWLLYTIDNFVANILYVATANLWQESQTSLDSYRIV